ncbi:rod shape-determining protein RodA [Desulfohalovibrio reitneri]|uniref:rod shape-determining protein RodA n=1 Tax=Desulfohalovibrio reitneri TaxID=1307759 RepID=UPI0004A779B0|nr:rod shape-determining protein RodA [Desulfohalovibrio reitneri]
MTPIDRRLLLHVNWTLLGLTAVLFGLGVLNLYSASGFRLEAGLSVSPYYQKQLVWGLVGLGGMLAFVILDYRHLKVLSWPLYWLTVALLLYVLFMGKVAGGSQRWISLGFISFQPSEMAKIAILVLGARLLAREAGPLDWRGLFRILCFGMLPAALIILEPDLGSGLNILLLLGGIILFRGLLPRIVKTAVVVLPAIVPLGWFLLHDYQKRRILTFLNPSEDPLGAGYHIIQSQIAIGSGQLTGKGFLAGTQSQLRFLPEKHTDFAVAVFGEEWGFIGTMVLLGLFCLFLYRIYMVARDAKDRFGAFLVAGVFFYFFWQILINMGMVLGLMPVVGIPLPFLSYGGSALFVNFCLIGLVLNVSMRRYVFKQS